MVGVCTSGGYGHATFESLVFAYVQLGAADGPEVRILGKRRKLTLLAEPAWDATNARQKGEGRRMPGKATDDPLTIMAVVTTGTGGYDKLYHSRVPRPVAGPGRGVFAGAGGRCGQHRNQQLAGLILCLYHRGDR